MKKCLAYFLAATLFICALTACTKPNQQNTLPQNHQNLVVYTSHREVVYGPIIKEFEERTGIWVSVVTGGSNALLKQIENEKASPIADIMFGGMAEVHSEYAHCLLPYKSANSDFLNKEYKEENDLWTPFSVLPIVITYNHKLLKEREVPTGWQSLLDPSFKGEICFANPENSASSFAALSIMVQACPEYGMEMISLFAENINGEEHLVQTSEELVNRIIEGKYTVGVTLEDVVLNLRRQGKEVGIVYPQEGTFMQADAVSVVQNAANLENAKQFIDFVTERDVQQMISEMGRRPVRVDTQPMQELPKTDEFALARYDLVWSSANRNAMLTRWKREF